MTVPTILITLENDRLVSVVASHQANVLISAGGFVYTKVALCPSDEVSAKIKAVEDRMAVLEPRA